MSSVLFRVSLCFLGLWLVACGGAEPLSAPPVSSPSSTPVSALPSVVPVPTSAPGLPELRPSPLGEAWRWSSPPLPTTSLVLSWESPEGEIYLAGRRGVLLRSADQGASWQQLHLPSMPNRPCGMGRGPDGALLLFTQEGLFRSLDHGASWTVSRVEALDRCGQVVQDTDGTLFAAVPFGVNISKDGGKTWRERKLSQSHIFRTIAIGPQGQLYTTGTIAEIYVSEDRGETWRSLGPKFWHDYQALWVSAKNEIYGVGSKGVISYSPDGGQSWQDYSRLVGADLYAVQGTPDGAVHITGEGGVLLRSEDQLFTVKIQDAALPTARKLGVAPDLRTLLRTQSGQWVAAGGYGAILTSPDGVSWTDRFSSLRGVYPPPLSAKDEAGAPRATAPATPPLRAVFARDETAFFVAGQNGTLYRSLDRGIRWDRLSYASGIVPPSFESIWGEGPTVLVVGDGRALLSQDGGGSFSPIALSNDQVAYTSFHDAWGTGDDLYIVGTSLVLRSLDGGKAWSYAVAPSEDSTLDLRGVWGSGSDDIYAVGGKTIYHGTNSGDNWEPLPTQAPADLYDVWGSGADDVYAVGAGGLVWHSTDEGKTWAREESGTTKTLRVIWGSSAREVYAAGDAGTLLRSTDRGKTWQALHSGQDSDIVGLHGTGAGRFYFTDALGEVIASDDGGRSFRRLYTVGPRGAASLPADLRRVFGFGEKTLLAVGGQGILYRSEDGGESWSGRANAEQSIKDIWGSGPENVFLVWEGGDIQRATDGKTFQTLDFSTEDEPQRIIGFGTEVVYVLTRSALYQSLDQGKSWQKLILPEGVGKLRDLWASATNDLYIAGTEGLLLRSTDGGANWKKIEAGLRSDLTAVQGAGPKEVYCAAQGGSSPAKLLKSVDGGRTWRPLDNTPWGGGTVGALLVAGPGDVYVSIIETLSETDRFGVKSHDEGRLYRSTDGGNTWREELLRTETPLYSLWRSPGGVITAVGAGELVLQRLEGSAKPTK